MTKTHIFAGCIAALLLASPALAADRINQIRVEGNQRIEPATVMSYVEVHPGDTFDPDLMDRALKGLYATGLFADVSLYQQGQDLVIAVSENPIISEIAFEGNKKVKDDLLMGELQLRPRTVFTRGKVQADVERLQDVYRLSGHFSARVEPKIIKLDQNRINLVFEISEGPTTYIARIAFVGNKKFDDADLQKVIRSREERWWRFWTSDDKYDADRVGYDRELLRKFYLDHGYADFHVDSAVAELSPDGKNFFVTFTVSEGERYRVGDVRIESRLQELDVAPLKKSITFNTGEWYKASEIENTVGKLVDALGNSQYAFVDVVPGVARNQAKRTVDIRFDLNEGQKAFVENINIHGNVRTLDPVIRRRMKLVEGDPFNASKLKKSEQNIKDLGFFEKASVKAVAGSAPDKTDIDVTVQEKSTGELSLGAGFSTNDGVLGNFTIREKNFLGRGQDLSLATTLSTKRSEFDFSFTEPYFLNRNLSAGIDLFHTTSDLQEESQYDSARTGGGLRFGYFLGDKLRQNVSYRLTSDRITNVSANASPFIKQQAGQLTTSSVSQTLTYETRDSRFDPTEGYVVFLTNEFAGLGGRARYVVTKAGGTYYYPVADKWVLSVLGEAGNVFGWGGRDVRINQRFYIGGDTLRGFRQSGIGPRDTATRDALGGNNYVRGSVQLNFPSGLPEDLGVKLHAFSDVGDLWHLDQSGAGISEDNLVRVSAGAGVTWISPMGPVTVDLARPITKADFDKTEMFRFTFGTHF